MMVRKLRPNGDAPRSARAEPPPYIEHDTATCQIESRGDIIAAQCSRVRIAARQSEGMFAMPGGEDMDRNLAERLVITAPRRTDV